MLKKLFMPAFAAVAIFAFTACNGNDDDSNIFAKTNDLIEDGQILDNMWFYGPSVVTTVETGATYTDKNAWFEITAANSESNSMIYMHATRFAAAMPAVEMRLLAEFQGSGKQIEAATPSVVPEAYIKTTEQWTPMARYIMTGFTAEIDGINCTVKFTCAGAYDVVFTGRLVRTPGK